MNRRRLAIRLLGWVVSLFVVLGSVREAAAIEPPPADPPPVKIPDSPSRRLTSRNDPVFLSVWQMHRGSLDARDIRAGLAAPLSIGDNYGIALLGSYGATWIAEPGKLPDQLRLHRFELLVGGGVGLWPGWSLRGAIGEAYASDLRTGARGDALQATVAAHLHNVVSNSDAWSLGLVYSETSNITPVLPTLGYVHQKPGSRFRFDAFLPRHIRVVYNLTMRAHVAYGIEAHGDKWLIERGNQRSFAERYGGVTYVEVGFAVTRLLKFDARLGASFDEYTLPDGKNGREHDQPLKPSAFAQLIVVVAP